MSLLQLTGLTLLAYLIWTYFGRLLRQRMVIKGTCINDLPLLGHSRTKEGRIKGTVVICGGRRVVHHDRGLPDSVMVLQHRRPCSCSRLP